MFEIRCLHCNFQQLTDVGAVTMRLRTLGLLRRGEPDVDLVAELAAHVAGQLACDACQSKGLIIRLATAQQIAQAVQRLRRNEGEDRDADDASAQGVPDQGHDDRWPQVRRACQECGAVIPFERLEVFPDSRHCAKCQAGVEVAGSDAEYCPRCGDLLHATLSSAGGLSRYQQRCTGCGYRGTGGSDRPRRRQ